MRQIWLTLLMWPLIVLPISAQRAPVSNLTTGFPIAPVEHGAQQIALGNSALALMGPWKFRLGDDLAWARCYWFWSFGYSLPTGVCRFRFWRLSTTFLQFWCQRPCSPF